MKNLWLFLFFILPFVGYSQINDEELAAEFLNNKEYDKAVILYEKLLKKDYSSPYYYQNLLKQILSSLTIVYGGLWDVSTIEYIRLRQSPL